MSERRTESHRSRRGSRKKLVEVTASGSVSFNPVTDSLVAKLLEEAGLPVSEQDNTFVPPDTSPLKSPKLSGGGRAGRVSRSY